jgi:hypothetical protein
VRSFFELNSKGVTSQILRGSNADFPRSFSPRTRRRNCLSAAHASQPQAKPQEVFAAYWTTEPGWETELQLKNNLATGSLTVTPVLRIADGTEFPLDSVVIASSAAVSVPLNQALLKS